MVHLFQIRGENPSIEEILNHANGSRKILVPVRKKSSSQTKRQKSSIKNVSGIAPKSKANSTKNVVSYSFGSGEKVVPIKDVFMNRINDIEVFKQDKRTSVQGSEIHLGQWY